MKEIYKNFFAASFSRVITALIGLAIIGFLTRHLGQAGYGAYETVLSYLFIFTILTDFGLHLIHVREISRHPEKESFISGNIFTLRLISLILVIILALAVTSFLPYSKEIKNGILIASIFVFFSSLSQILSGIFQKYNVFYYVSFFDVFSRLIQLGLVLYAVKINSSLLTFIWILSLTAAIQFWTVFLASRRLVKFSLAFDPVFIKKIIKASFPIALSILFTAIYIRTDALMLSLMKPASDVGIYRLAAKVLESAVFFPALLVELTMPTLSFFALTSPPLFKKSFRKTLNLLFVLGTLAALAIFLLAKPIILVLGGEGFLDSVLPLKILALVIGLVFLNNLSGKSLIALDLQRAGMKIYIFGAILNIFLNLLVIPRYSYLGASYATLITEVLVTAMMFRVLYQKTDLFQKRI